MSFLLGIPSPVFMFLNAEAWTITTVLLSDAQPLGVALMVALGQCVGYTLVYFNGPWLVARLPKLEARLKAFDFERYRHASYAMLFLGCVAVFPPALLFTLLSRQLGFRYPFYLAVIMAGRCARFTILALLPQTFAAWFKA